MILQTPSEIEREFNNHFICRYIIETLVGIDDTETIIPPLRYLVVNNRYTLNPLTLKLSVLKCNMFEWKFIEIIDQLIIIILYYISNSNLNQNNYKNDDFYNLMVNKKRKTHPFQNFLYI